MQAGIEIGDMVIITNPDFAMRAIKNYRGKIVGSHMGHDNQIVYQVRIKGSLAKHWGPANCYAHELTVIPHTKTKLGRLLYGKRY